MEIGTAQGGLHVFPPDVIAASFGLDPDLFAGLPKRGDVVIALAPSADRGLAVATPAP